MEQRTRLPSAQQTLTSIESAADLLEQAEPNNSVSRLEQSRFLRDCKVSGRILAARNLEVESDDDALVVSRNETSLVLDFLIFAEDCDIDSAASVAEAVDQVKSPPSGTVRLGERIALVQNPNHIDQFPFTGVPSNILKVAEDDFIGKIVGNGIASPNQVEPGTVRLEESLLQCGICGSGAGLPMLGIELDVSDNLGKSGNISEGGVWSSVAGGMALER